MKAFSRGRGRGGFIGEFGAGRRSAETKERLGSAEGTGDNPNSQQVCAHQGRESEVKRLRGVGVVLETARAHNGCRRTFTEEENKFENLFPEKWSSSRQRYVSGQFWSYCSF